MNEQRMKGRGEAERRVERGRTGATEVSFSMTEERAKNGRRGKEEEEVEDGKKGTAAGAVEEGCDA